ncbi:hypothetical protein D8L93_03550 [Sodalis-like symbiont of Bactericera trigonica]|nr:hypothetical protein D8L93_03550 [Sodalis-like symbiont of Bactericera trigonica]
MAASPALAPDCAHVNRETPMPLLLALTKFIRRLWWIVVLVAALSGSAGYWRGAQQARLAAQATLATRQAECEARQRKQAQATPGTGKRPDQAATAAGGQ